MTWRFTGAGPETSQTKTYSFDRSGMNFPSGPKVRLKPLVRISRVFPSGEMASAAAWPAVNAGSPGRSGLSA
jgi:hypothetical protein